MKKPPIKLILKVLLSLSTVFFLFFLISDFVIETVNPSFSLRIMINLIFAIVTAGLVSAAILIFNPVISDAMVTLRRMLRVESLSNPILMKLSSEAPGTYHHSLNVSTLAQKAAKSVGADSLLVRTAAYYHDLGKLLNPSLYVENQAGIEVPTAEDADSIRKNANAIIAHVSSGVKLAEEANLPEDIINLIKEHHGTTRALYYFYLAKEKGLKIKKTDFRYNGPIAQSKESAILMLADCVEATARAMPRLDNEKIKQIVQNALEERMQDDQFKNSKLTELDFAKIKKSLEETLQSIYHQRIEYGTKKDENQN